MSLDEEKDSLQIYINLSKASSTKELTDFLTNQWPSNNVKNALNRMRAVIDTPDCGPDILIKILPDLDVAFFNGLIRNKIQVSWQDEYSMQASGFPRSDFHLDLGSTEFDSLNGICYVFLNRHNICDEPDPRQAMSQTLLDYRSRLWSSPLHFLATYLALQYLTMSIAYVTSI